jgi:hypothetical protein
MVRVNGPRNNDPVEVNCTYVRHTNAENQIQIVDADDKEHFLPVSQIEIDPKEPEEGDDITITMPEWLAEKEGLV